jgi:hypothetical protein
LAGALGFKGDLEEARAALNEATKLKPEVNSFAEWQALQPWATDPRYLKLAEPTLHAGLRRAGFGLVVGAPREPTEEKTRMGERNPQQ